MPESETHKYYTGHHADFEAAEWRRLSIPKSGQGINVDKARSKAEEPQKGAAAGGDLQELQQDAYKDLGINSSLPPTKFPMTRRNNLINDERDRVSAAAAESSGSVSCDFREHSISTLPRPGGLLLFLLCIGGHDWKL